MLGQGIQGQMGGGQGQGMKFPWQQALQAMRQKQAPQGGIDLTRLLSMLSPMMGGGTGMAGLGQAQQVGQQGLGMANQGPLSLFNPGMGGTRPWR